MKNATSETRLIGKGWLWAFVLITLLFFLWGFSRSMLDVLNSHFQQSMHISLQRSTLVQGATYLAYALMSIPAGILITRCGYRKGIVTGLSTFAAGALLFIPGAVYSSFDIYIVALFIIGCGLALLETSANPYIAELGPAESAASRLNLAQSFNGLGCILGPVCLGAIVFSSNGSIALPYGVLGGFVIALAILLSRVPLPEIVASAGRGDSSVDACRKTSHCSFKESSRWLWRHNWFVAGLGALFCYEIAEIGINSMFINYAVSQHWLTNLEATSVLSFGALTLFMLSRIGASVLMRRFNAAVMLTVCAAGAAVSAMFVALNIGTASHIALFGCYIFEAMIFPTVFAIIVSRAGTMAKTASAYMMLTPLGGAVGTIAMGGMASNFDISTTFLLPCLSYAGVMIYATVLSAKKLK